MPDPVCISCGYSLAGLPREALCPECAFPVARSLDATPLLRTAEPKWLRRVAIGLALWQWGLLIAAFPVVAYLLPGVAVRGAGLSSGSMVTILWPTPIAPVMVLSKWCAIAITALAIPAMTTVAGIWLMSSQTAGPQSVPRRTRALARWGPVTFIAAFVTLAWLLRLPARPAGLVNYPYLFVVVGALASFYGMTGLLEHLERATILCRPDVAKRARTTRILIAVGFGLAALRVMARMSAAPGAPDPSIHSLVFGPLTFASLFAFYFPAVRLVQRGVRVERRDAQYFAERYGVAKKPD